MSSLLTHNDIAHFKTKLDTLNAQVDKKEPVLVSSHSATDLSIAQNDYLRDVSGSIITVNNLCVMLKHPSSSTDDLHLCLSHDNVDYYMWGRTKAKR